MKAADIFTSRSIILDATKLKSFWEEVERIYGKSKVEHVVSYYGFGKYEDVVDYHDLFMIQFALEQKLWLGDEYVKDNQRGDKQGEVQVASS